jgi:hypothetical protein
MSLNLMNNVEIAEGFKFCLHKEKNDLKRFHILRNTKVYSLYLFFDYLLTIQLTCATDAESLGNQTVNQNVWPHSNYHDSEFKSQWKSIKVYENEWNHIIINGNLNCKIMKHSLI